MSTLITLTHSFCFYTEYEVISTTKGPDGEQVSILVTNQTHTAVENLKPESRYAFDSKSFFRLQVLLKRTPKVLDRCILVHVGVKYHGWFARIPGSGQGVGRVRCGLAVGELPRLLAFNEAEYRLMIWWQYKPGLSMDCVLRHVGLGNVSTSHMAYPLKGWSPTQSPQTLQNKYIKCQGSEDGEMRTSFRLEFDNNPPAFQYRQRPF